MIKLFCDRCGEKITDKYYTIAFTEHYIDGRCETMGKLSVIETYIRPTALEELSSQKMYCSDCKNKLEYK